MWTEEHLSGGGIDGQGVLGIYPIIECSTVDCDYILGLDTNLHGQNPGVLIVGYTGEGVCCVDEILRNELAVVYCDSPQQKAFAGLYTQGILAISDAINLLGHVTICRMTGSVINIYAAFVDGDLYIGGGCAPAVDGIDMGFAGIGGFAVGIGRVFEVTVLQQIISRKRSGRIQPSV